MALAAIATATAIYYKPIKNSIIMKKFKIYCRTPYDGVIEVKMPDLLSEESALTSLKNLAKIYEKSFTVNRIDEKSFQIPALQIEYFIQ